MAIKLSHDLSGYPLLIRMEFAETGAEMAIGTGFIYEFEEFYYLITNGHCLTGVNPETLTRISKHAGYPTIIRTGVRVKVDEASLKLGGHVIDAGSPNLSYGTLHPEKPIIDLYKDENHLQPTWFIHPIHGYLVDVVAIPICEKKAVPPHLFLFPLNKYPFEVEPQVADDVFVLGYPFGITDPLELPIWKKGSIASEPSIPFKGLPRMLIDTATRSGMSGSPVIIKRTGVFGPDEDERFGTAAGFAGVYSGRYGVEKDGNNKEDVQLGIVWRKEVIEEILVGRVQGTTEFQRM